MKTRQQYRQEWLLKERQKEQRLNEIENSIGNIKDLPLEEKIEAIKTEITKNV